MKPMNDQILTILAHARIAAMLREAESYRLLIERRPLPPPRPPLLGSVRRSLASALQRAADALMVGA